MHRSGCRASRRRTYGTRSATWERLSTASRAFSPRHATSAKPGTASAWKSVDIAAIVSAVRGWAANDLQGVRVQELVEEPIVAHADRRLLGQIVLNLVTNAAHAARLLPSPRVRLHVYGSVDAAILSVRDNGPGVPPEESATGSSSRSSRRAGAGAARDLG